MQPFPQALPYGTELGNFELRSVLGQGGGGFAYLCYDTLLEREVVLKEHFPPALCRRTPQGEVAPLQGAEEAFEQSLDLFLHEARILAGLNHPGIVRILEVLPSHGTAVAVMEPVQGETANVYLARYGKDAGTIENLLRQLLEILSFLHSNSIIHRDIKPANIIVKADGNPVLLDFGAALRGEPEGERTIIGTPAFAAPEQFDPSGNIGPWSDIYALGTTFMQILGAERVGQLPRRLRRTLYRATRKETTRRFPNAEAALRALNRPPRALWICGGLAALAALALSPLLILQGGEESKEAPAPEQVPAAQPNDVTEDALYSMAEHIRRHAGEEKSLNFTLPEKLKGYWIAINTESGRPFLVRFEDDTHYTQQGAADGTYEYQVLAPKKAKLILTPDGADSYIFELSFDFRHRGHAQRPMRMPMPFELEPIGTAPAVMTFEGLFTPEEYAE